MKAVGFGGVLRDQIPTASGPPRRAIGGAVFNVMAHLARLGDQSAIITALGNDRLGDEALHQAAGHGVGTQWVQRVKSPTCLVTVSLGSRGEPSYQIPQHTSWDAISADQAILDGVHAEGADCFFYGTIEQRGQEARDALRCIISEVSFRRTFADLNLRPPHSSAESIEFTLAHCTDVKLNGEEARHVAGVIGERWDGPESFCTAVRQRFGIAAVVVTNGDAGCVFQSEEAAGRAVAYPVAGGDRVGAGAGFMAGLAHRLWAGDSLAAACDFANRSGALVASRRGAVPRYTVDEREAVG